VYCETEYPRRAFGWSALRSLTTADWKLIDAPRPELYDRRFDPQELENVIALHPEEASALRAELEEMVADMTPGNAEPVELDAVAAERLRSLGYVAAGEPDGGDERRSGTDPKDMVEVYRGLMRAKSLMKRQDFQGVIAALEPLVATSPGSAELRATLGEAYLRTGRYVEAERELGASLLQLSHDPARWVALGDAQRAVGKPAAAEASYRRAVEVSPNYGQAWSRLGVLAATRGDPEEAELHFTRCVELSPSSANALANLANVLLQLGRPAESVGRFEAALSQQPDYAPAHAGLWRALVASGRRGDAVEALRRALGVLPDDPELSCDLAWLLATSRDAALRDGSGALALARSACEVGGVTVRELDVLAAAYAEHGEYTRAVETMRSALRAAERLDRPTQAMEARLRLYESGRPYRE